MRSGLIIGTLGILAVVKAVALQSAAAQELLHTLDVGPLYHSRYLDISSDDRFIATYRVHGGREVLIWDVATGKQVASLEPEDDRRKETIAFVPGKNTVAILGHANLHRITFWDFETDETRVLNLHDVADDGRSMRWEFSFSPDGRFLALPAAEAIERRGEQWFVRVVRTQDGSLVADLPLRGIGRQFRFSGDGSTLIVSDEFYRRGTKGHVAYVHEWDFQQQEERNEWGPFPMAGAVGGWDISSGGLELSPNGRLLATKVGNRVVVVDAPTGQFMNTGAHRAVAFDPQGYYFAGGEVTAQRVSLWPLDASRSFKQLDLPEVASIAVVKFSPSGKLLVAAGHGLVHRGAPEGGKLYVWRMDDGAE